mgnify:CR=1 FL=1
MSNVFEIEAQDREDTGKGASRRLRRQGLVPGILYGASDRSPRMISLVPRLRHLLVRRHDVEGSHRHADQRLVLGDH